MNRENLFIEIKKYISDLEEKISSKKIDLSYVQIDHVCYKCSAKEEYENLRSEFEFTEKFIFQSIISKRRIAVVGFCEQFLCVFGELKYLELSDQKPDGSQKSMVDHVELVPKNISYEELVKMFSDTGEEIIENNLPHHKTYDVVLGNGIKIKLSRGMLVDKIYKEEMV